MGPTDEAVTQWFRFHPGTPVTGPMHDKVRADFESHAKELLALLPPGADRTIALRKLQEAMWAANSCIANAGFASSA